MQFSGPLPPLPGALISMSSLFSLFALLGHVAVWTWYYNRLHASSVPSRLVSKLEKLLIVAMVVSIVPPAWLMFHGTNWLANCEGTVCWLGRTWALACCLMLGYITAAWTLRRVKNGAKKSR